MVDRVFDSGLDGGQGREVRQVAGTGGKSVVVRGKAGGVAGRGREDLDRSKRGNGRGAGRIGRDGGDGDGPRRRRRPCGAEGGVGDGRDERAVREEVDAGDGLAEAPRGRGEGDLVADVADGGIGCGEADAGRIGGGLIVEDRGGGEGLLRAAGRRPGEAQTGGIRVFVVVDGKLPPVDLAGFRVRDLHDHAVGCQFKEFFFHWIPPLRVSSQEI